MVAIVGLILTVTASLYSSTSRVLAQSAAQMRLSDLEHSMRLAQRALPNELQGWRGELQETSAIEGPCREALLNRLSDHGLGQLEINALFANTIVRSSAYVRYGQLIARGLVVAECYSDARGVMTSAWTTVAEDQSVIWFLMPSRALL